MKLRKLLSAALCFSIFSSVANAMEEKKPFSSFVSQIQKVTQKTKYDVPAFGNSYLKNAPQDYFTIHCSDRKLTIPLTNENDKKIKSLKKESAVLRSRITDGISVEKELFLPVISSLELNKTLVLLTKIDQHEEIKKELNDLSEKEIVFVVKTSNALNIEKLLQKASIAAATRIAERIKSMGDLSQLEEAVNQWQELELPYDVDEKIVPHIDFLSDPFIESKSLQHTSIISSVALSADGKICASGDDYKTVRIWNTINTQSIATLDGHDWVESVALSADGRICASASDDTTVRVWNTSTRQIITTFNRHADWVTCVALSADGKICASASADKTAYIWYTDTKEVIIDLKKHTNFVNRVALSADGRILASSSDKTVHIWNTDTQQLIATLIGHTDRINGLALSADGKICASCGSDKTVRIWNTDSGQVITTLNGHIYNQVMGVALSANGKICASGGVDKMIRIWDTDTSRSIATLDGHDWVKSVALSADGKICASASDDKTVRIWNLKPLFETPRVTVDQVMLLSFLLKHGQENKLIDLKMFPVSEACYSSLPPEIKQRVKDNCTILTTHNWKKWASIF